MDLGGPWADVELVPVADYPPDAEPAVHLNEARAAMAGHHWARRADALAVAAADPVLADQVEAERALDAAVGNRVEEAERRARALLAVTADPVVRARAAEALGRALLWRGRDTVVGEGARAMTEAVDGYRRLGSTEWAGNALFWLGNAGHFQRGQVEVAEALMREALAELDMTSARRSTVLTFLVDVLLITGRWRECEAALAEAQRLADTRGEYFRAYVAWARARLACQRGDRVGTVRAISEVEHNLGDWFEIHTGATFLGDAAAMLERVGDSEQARAYLDRAVARDATDEFVHMAEAELLARSGNPEEALVALRSVAHAPWLEIVAQWRMTLLAAWASLRAGRVSTAREVAVRAFAEADAIGGPAVARTGEPRLTRLLAPLAAQEGSAHAARLLTGSGTSLRLLGRPELTLDAQPVTLPPGLPGTLLRMVAVHEHGVDAEQVIDALWPGTDLTAGRKMLRTTLSRLNQRAGDLVVREETRLVLADMWVDLRAFRSTADQALSERQPEVVIAALAMWTGEPLAGDVYAEWAQHTREALIRRRLRLLDLAADLMPDRAEVYLEQAIEADPDDTSRYEWLAHLLDTHNRLAAASRWRTRARARG